jgi:hypothetical protein
MEAREEADCQRAEESYSEREDHRLDENLKRAHGFKKRNFVSGRAG